MGKKNKRRGSSGFSHFAGRFINGLGIVIFFLSKFLPLVVIAILIGGVYHGVQNYLYADPYFRLDVIRVKTDLPFTSKEIEQMSGLRLGVNLLAVDLGRAALRIERLPEIKIARVTRILPNAIEILAFRRFEVFQVKPKGQNRYYAIDDQGKILPKTDVYPLAGLVQIEEAGLESKSIGIGDVYPSKYLGQFKQLYQFLKQESEIARETPEKISADHLGNLTVTLAGGFELRLGKNFVKNLKKLRGLKHLLGPSQRAKIEYLDLEYQDVVVKMKENERLAL